MKKIILTALIAFGFSNVAEAQIKVGAHFGYGTHLAQPLIGANAEFLITKKISIAPDFSLYTSNKVRGYKDQLWEINGNGHYYITQVLDDKMNIFGLAGINYAKFSSKYISDGYPSNGVFKSENNEIGVNFGGGVTYYLDKNFEAFSTVKYTAVSTDQLSLQMGVRYTF
ncbi:MAG: hypothetical protein Q4B43_03830 [Bacteroidota bacterium]|nr:hypothetical protein [Bacteroidota bacterium]